MHLRRTGPRCNVLETNKRALSTHCSADIAITQRRAPDSHRPEDDPDERTAAPERPAPVLSGGQAIHYSPYFARDGYNGASHGCVNLRDFKAAEWLFDRVPMGTRVHVYRS